MQDFNEDIREDQREILTTFKGQDLLLKEVKRYEGPITMQYLPYGGIQSVFGGLIILNCRNGFFSSSQVVYQSKEFSSSEFIRLYGELVNTVLPS